MGFFRIWPSQTVSNRVHVARLRALRADLAKLFGSVANVPFILASLHIQVSELAVYVP